MLQSPAPTRANLNVFARRLKTAAARHFQVRESSLIEALSRGLGGRTHASLLAQSAMQPSEPVCFNHAEFVARLTELKDARTAEAVGALLDGIRIVVTVTKRSTARQRAVNFTDIAYDVTAEVQGADGAILYRQPQFFLPEFRAADGTERYRIDSAAAFRADERFPVTRQRNGRELMTAKLIDGRWEGGLYVYATDHQQDDARCVRSVKASLARHILPAVTPRVRCRIFRPDSYDYGAWRVEMTVGPAIQAYWEYSPLRFDLPSLPHRRFHAEKPDVQYMPDTDLGQFVDGVWSLDIYSNGIPEDGNPTPISQVRAALLASVNATLQRAGFPG
ncbi:hypothetical protein [Bordetella genomosp. 11]|uniref:Uncharacterized protein n=1 Tax=Bordetella genomosp. 11 TaxID=1416808 RepID=A0A261UJR0_9BORD|nr:hypothetical protein [Bordetella genomosp. 11]OZI62128.1 hypothetical protein CAL28_23165 [Bordetella genomosp. 11]